MEYCYIVIEDDIDENGTSKLMPFTKKGKKLPSSCDVYAIKSKFKDFKTNINMKS